MSTAPEGLTISRNDFQTAITQRAWKDEAFRAEFLADPKGTIEKYAGQKLPAGLKIVTHAEDDSTLHFVIPNKPANADELSDEDLEKVAGGIDFFIGTIIGVLIAGTVVGTAMSAADYGTRANNGW